MLHCTIQKAQNSHGTHAVSAYQWLKLLITIKKLIAGAVQYSAGCVFVLFRPHFKACGHQGRAHKDFGSRLNFIAPRHDSCVATG